MKVLILYYSGVGNTKYIAHRMDGLLKSNNLIELVDIYSIESFPNDLNINNYDRLIIGFPTIHSAPAKPIINFINSLDISGEILTFVYCTYGLYSANSIRIFSKKARDKNLITIYTNSYRSPATDGILLTPYIKQWYKFEKNINETLSNDLNNFIKIKDDIINIPTLKWYTPLNYINKVIGERKKFTIYLDKKLCVKCNLCIDECPTNAYMISKDNYPVFNKDRCINCYRCIHHCPKLALSLYKNKRTKKVIKY